MKKILIGSAGLLISLGVAHAAIGGGVLDIIALAQTIVVRLGQLAFGVAMLAFFWFLIQLIISKSKGNAEKASNDMHGLMWSIAALFVMFSIYGIIALIGGTTGIQQGGPGTNITPAIPTGPTY